ncbi:MAG: DUF7168 domain-containing protein [Ferruginibacter sp.]
MENDIALKIKKLLKLGESNNANEAANAMVAAQSLMDKYRISVAEVEAQTGTKQENIAGDTQPILCGGRIMTWKKVLLSALVKHNGCAHYLRHAHRDAQYFVFGRPSDIDTLRYMFAYAVSELGRLSILHCKGQGHSFHDSWYNGAALGIVEKLNLDRKAASQTDNSTAIVLVSNRENEALSAMRSNIRLGASKAQTWNGRFNSDAYANGKAVGSNMNLSSKGLGSGSNSRLLSS